MTCRPALLPLLTLICPLLFAPVQSWAVDANSDIDFNRDIRPILSDKCFSCHGPDEKHRKAKLRLDVADGPHSPFVAARAKWSGAAIVPGKPAQSPVFQRITTADADDRMPPASTNKTLTAREVKLLRQWIESGAKYQGHWAFIKPTRPATPAVDNRAWVTNAGDAFILSQLEQRGIAPAPPADRRTLIRRLSFDLTGLPPTPAQVEAFVNDKSPDAYKKVVDRLLASPHYGERMAQYWLDVVRYADSIGYHSDNPRNVWLYRNYVIEAFNKNKPFDVFTREQLAGDLMGADEGTKRPSDQGTKRENPAQDPRSLDGSMARSLLWERKIASGYNRLLQTTQEGGSQAKEYTAKYAADRVRNVSAAWLGVTIGCAECHDHKYDPFSQREFYSIAAFFADVQETPVGRQGETAVPTAEHLANQDDLNKQLATAEAELRKATLTVDQAQPAWEADLLKELAENERVDVAYVDDQRLPKGANKQSTWHYINKSQGPVFSGNQSRRQTAGGLVQHFFYQSKETITIQPGDTLYAYIWLDPKNPPQQVMLQFHTSSWEHRAWWGADKIPFGGVGTNGPNHKKQGDLPDKGKWVRLEVQPAQVGLKPGAKVNGFAFTQWGGLAYWDKAGVSRNGIDLPTNLIAVLKTPRDQRNKKDADALANHFRSVAPQLKPLRDKVASIKKQRDDLNKTMPKTLVTVAVNPRTMRILPRGNWLDDSGEVVQPTTPGVLGSLKTDSRATRLDLANWVVSRDNPLTARVFVNRLWMLLFGEGLARSLDDFGSQGQWPTHPRLLDWLAVEFVESGWDVKHMVRLIVSSSAYRMSSKASPELRRLDPYNKLLARQGRFRIDAEFVRDNALSIAGLLVNDLGGPSVKPYQPAGYWQHLNFPRRSWNPDAGDSLYRRGMYTHWQRSFLHPAMLAFDAPSREECTVQRPRSNTPLQALVLLNDPQYVEAARTFAERIVRAGGKTPASRINFAYQQALQRDANRFEVALLSSIFNKHAQRYKADAEAAKQLLSVGAKPAPTDIDAAELAAWTNIARIVLNLHETITRY